MCAGAAEAAPATGLQSGARKLFRQRLPVVGGFETDRHALALDGDLRRQAHLYFRRMLRDPLLEAGQLVGAAYGECVAVFEGHRDQSVERAAGGGRAQRQAQRSRRAHIIF